MKLLKILLLLVSCPTCLLKCIKIMPVCPPLADDINSNCQNISIINTAYDLSPQTSFDIMPGSHVLLSDIVVEDVYDFTMIGSSEVMMNRSRALRGYQTDVYFSFSMSTSVIDCASSTGLIFSNITNLSLINLTLMNCGDINEPAMSTVNVRNLLLHGVTFVNSSSVGLYGYDVSGNSTVVNSTFVGSRLGLVLLNSSVTIVDSRFGNLNRAIAANGSTVRCWGCRFQYNTYGLVFDTLSNSPAGSPSSYPEIQFINSNFANCFHGVHLNNSIASFFNCEFAANRLAATMYRGIANIYSTTFSDGYTSLLLTKTSITLSNVTIVRSRNSAMRAILSRLNLTGNVSINDSYLANGYGGALYLLSSVVYLSAPARVVFFNNTAVIGGAVFVRPSYASTQRNVVEICFIQVHDLYGTLSNPGVQLIFINNAAPRGGSALYADIKTCTLEQTPSLNYNETNPMNVFNAISYGISYSNSSNMTQSNIQYEAVAVTFCEAEDGRLEQKMITNQVMSIYPGTATRVWIASIDVYNNPVPATIFTQTNNIVRLEYFITGQSCQPYNLPDVIIANNFSTTIYFGMETSDYGALGWEVAKPNTRINVKKILPCPSGFEYLNNVCNCSDFLLNKNVVCNISEQSFSALASTSITWWLGTQDENSTKLAYSPNCPLEYCNANLSIVYPSQRSNTRCNFNRSGVLCGRCSEGFSETFGEPLCARCESNNYIAFLAMFAALGLVIVVLIFTLDLTVSEGTINELIFYANIINIFSTSMFSSAITVNPFIKFLYVFISWLNLDIGIELCFYNGMDNYQKAWLQFGFSLYLLVIVSIIVIVSHQSKRIAALCGRNVLPVLATIIRLSYTKVLKNVISIFESANLHDVDTGTRYSVWLYDGNIEYMGTPHLVMCIFGVIVTVVFIIPYTIVILFSTWLLKLSHRKIFCWVRTLTPYFDSYHAPYKNRYRFWTGFLLVIRILLSGVVLSLPDDRTTSMLIAVIVLIVVFTIFIGLRVYKKKYLLILGSYFYLNLIFICLMMLLIEGNQYVINTNLVRIVVIGVAIGSAFCCFVGILVFHGCTKIAKQIGIPSLRLKEFELTTIRHVKPLATDETSCELRESLLV